jgi:hypothetical protein
MAIYVAMEPPEGEGAQERAILVRDGFSGFAFVLPVVWLLGQRLWIEALGAFALTVASAALVAQSGGQPGLGFTLSVLTGLYFGLEGSVLRIGALRRRGFREWGSVEAKNMREAELRYAVQAADEQAPANTNSPLCRPACNRSG